jgi:hypothetical protein
MQVTSYVLNDYYMNRVVPEVTYQCTGLAKKVTVESYDLTCESGARDIYLPFQVLSKYRLLTLQLVSARCNGSALKNWGWSMALLNKFFPSRKKAYKQGYVTFGKSETER